MNNYLPFTGVGSRKTPEDVQEHMTLVARVLEEASFTLRSGGADGADKAFEAGVSKLKEIYIPWGGFNNRSSVEEGVITGWPNKMTGDFAKYTAARLHPNWDACSAGARKLHARNMAQLLGHTMLQPSLFVVCWTPNGSGSGGTGQALRGAAWLGIPIFDFGKGINETFKNLSNHVEQILYKEE